MPVPFEALLPYGIMIAMFGISGTGLAAIRTWQNEGKNPRYALDQWDRQSTTAPTDAQDNQRETDSDLVMERDRRLTGKVTGQIANATAPAGFELNHPWKLEKRFS